MTPPDLLQRQLRDLPYFRATLRAVEARFLRAVDLPAPTLDVGSGDGHFASVTFDRRLEIGLDPHHPSLRESRERDAYHLLVQADGGRMPHPSGAFASALSNSVLEHIPQLDAVLNETGRVLQSGAPFVFTVPNPGYRDQLSLPRWLHKLGLGGPAEAYRRWFMRMSRTWNLFDEQAWSEKLDRAGFDVVESQRYFSPAALQALEWGHYFGLPSLISRWLTGRWILAPWRWNLRLTEKLVRRLISRWLTGRWILAPWRWNLRLTEKLVRRYFEEQPSSNGTYTYYRARRR